MGTAQPRPCILLVDDEPEMLEMTTYVAEAARPDFAVISEGDPDRAISMLCGKTRVQLADGTDGRIVFVVADGITKRDGKLIPTGIEVVRAGYANNAPGIIYTATPAMIADSQQSEPDPFGVLGKPEGQEMLVQIMRVFKPTPFPDTKQ